MTFDVMTKVSVVTMRVKPGDSIELNYIDPDGVKHHISRRVTDRIDIDEIIVYQNDGEYGIDYGIANYHGIKH